MKCNSSMVLSALMATLVATGAVGINLGVSGVANAHVEKKHYCRYIPPADRKYYGGKARYCWVVNKWHPHPHPHKDGIIW